MAEFFEAPPPKIIKIKVKKKITINRGAATAAKNLNMKPTNFFAISATF